MARQLIKKFVVICPILQISFVYSAYNVNKNNQPRYKYTSPWSLVFPELKMEIFKYLIIDLVEHRKNFKDLHNKITNLKLINSNSNEVIYNLLNNKFVKDLAHKINQLHPNYPVSPYELAKTLLPKPKFIKLKNFLTLSLNDPEGLGSLLLGSLKHHNNLPIKLLISQGANVNYCSYFTETPLIYASKKGYINITRRLIAGGADLDLPGLYHQVPLFIAIIYGHSKTAKILIESSANLNIANNRGCTPLMAAIKNNDILIIQLLINNGAKINLKDREGYTELMYASYNGNIDCVKLLVLNGALLNEQNHEGLTALMCASQVNNLNIVIYLLNEGADPLLKDTLGKTAYKYACTNKHKELKKILKNYNEKSSYGLCHKS